MDGQHESAPSQDATEEALSIQVYNQGLREYVEIRNSGPRALALSGWVLASLRGCRTYNFAPVVLAPGSAIRIHSGLDAYDAPPSDFLWTTETVWHNGSDIAAIFDAKGREVARCSYRHGQRLTTRHTPQLRLTHVPDQEGLAQLIRSENRGRDADPVSRKLPGTLSEEEGTMFSSARRRCGQARTEWLCMRLSARYGKPDGDGLAGLADAAQLVQQGELTWQQAENAIDAGWDPSSEHIAKFLRTVRCRARGGRDAT